MRPFAFACALTFCVCSAGAQRPGTLQAPSQLTAPQTGPTGATRSNVLYGVAGKEKLKLDIYLPKVRPASPVPAVLLIHGGGWIEGDKSDMAPYGRALAKNGYAAFSISYRLLDGKKNPWPAQLEDAQAAVRWVRAHAADYNADPDRIGVLGYSAGAQVASMLGVLSTMDGNAPAADSTAVQAVVALSGPSDFASEASRDPGTLDFFARLLGASQQQDPARWRAASPALNVNSNNPPFLLVHGTRDGIVPITQSEELRAALQSHGVPVTFVTVDDDHDLQEAETQKAIAAAMLKFFDAAIGTGRSGAAPGAEPGN